MSTKGKRRECAVFKIDLNSRTKQRTRRKNVRGEQRRLNVEKWVSTERQSGSFGSTWLRVCVCQGREAVMREHIGTRKTGRLRSDRVTEQRDDRKWGAG